MFDQTLSKQEFEYYKIHHNPGWEKTYGTTAYVPGPQHPRNEFMTRITEEEMFKDFLGI